MSFASPWLLLTLLLPLAALAVYIWLERRPARYAVPFPNVEILASVAARRSTWRRHVPAALLFVSLATLAVAVARPTTTSPVATSGTTVILTVDTSGSMRATDVPPSRIEAAQAAMLSFVDHLPSGVHVGVISFSSTPEVVTAPTTDYDLVRQGIALLAPGFRTAIGDAVARSAELAEATVGVPEGLLPAGSKPPAAIILLSDGAQTSGFLSPDEGADRAKQAGIPVYTIALGTSQGGSIPPGGFGGGGGPGFGGGGGFRRLLPDPVTLARIARITGGTAYTAQTASRLESIYRKLGSRVTSVEKPHQVTALFVLGGAVLLLAAAGIAAFRLPRLP